MVDILYKLMNLLYGWLYGALVSQREAAPSAERKEEDDGDEDEEYNKSACRCALADPVPGSGDPGAPSISFHQWKDICSTFSLKAFLYFGGFEVIFSF